MRICRLEKVIETYGEVWSIYRIVVVQGEKKKKEGDVVSKPLSQDKTNFQRTPKRSCGDVATSRYVDHIRCIMSTEQQQQLFSLSHTTECSTGPPCEFHPFYDKTTNMKSSTAPQDLSRASMRMQLPPSYVVVGAYRLLTDQKLLKPTWDKCRHATRRGAIVGGIWARYLICPGLSSSHFFFDGDRLF